MSWPLPQRFEIAEFLLRLAGDAPRFAGTADGKKVAPGARALVGSGRQEPDLDRAIDDLERLESDPPVRLVDGDFVIGEPSRRRAVEEPPRMHAGVERLLDGEAVQDGLEDAAPADHGLPGRAVPAGLVIGDAEETGSRSLPLDEIDRSAQLEPPVDEDRIRDAGGVPRGVVHVGPKAERELEERRFPAGRLRQPAHPYAQVARDVGDLVAPDAIDRRR